MKREKNSEQLIAVQNGDEDCIYRGRIRRRSFRVPTAAYPRRWTPAGVVIAYLSFVVLRAQALIPPRSTSMTTLFPSRAIHHHRRFSPRTTTQRHMVLTTPEAIIEQASTQNLLDDLIDESVRTSARRPIMMQFDPSGGWIWKRWQGTIFSETWDSCVARMIYACAVFLICRTYPGIKEPLSGFNVLWGQLLSVTTFTLTFFVNQSYALWRKCYELSRRLQGRLHDLNLSLVAHAARKPASSPNEPTTYTPAARQVLDLVSRYVRLFNLLTYASFTRSHRPILTPRGMRRLVERGLMTPQEREVLVDCEIPATQRHNAVLLWIIRVFVEAREAGHFHGGAGFEDQWLEKAHVCRAQYGAIGDELQGRMPLAYAHIVQVLVDFVLWMYPFMAFSSGMSGFVCVLGTGLLTIGYQGLFDLAKQFLDPYDNESYGKGEDPLVVDTLIAETNAGSIRWVNGLNEMPVSYQKIKDGELSDHLLPVRGYSVEELEQMEKEKRELERELHERREHEEAERRKQEELKDMVRRAAEAMIPARLDTSLSTSPFVSLMNGNATSFALSVGEDLLMPNILTTTNLSVSQDLAKFIDDALAMKGAVPQRFVPDKTALVEPATKIPKKKGKKIPKTKTPINGVPSEAEVETPASVADDKDNEFSVFQDSSDEAGYFDHTFEAFDPYNDIPWHDEVGPDGQERRLSQIMADEVWEEEKEAEREKQAPMSYEEYLRRVHEIEDAELSELLETQEILMAGPGAESDDLSTREITHVESGVYDQTKLDGVSQLWGLPPNELSELPAYEEPPIPTLTSDGISQLWSGEKPTSSSQKESRATDPEEAHAAFSGLSQLWGEPIGDGDQHMKTVYSRTDDENEGPRQWGGHSPDKKEYRMSEMLAEEVWHEEKEPLQEPYKFEDYEKQVEEIRRLEREELLETQAILNAPPGANYVDVPGQHEDPLSLANTTEPPDDLSILEMDISSNGTDVSPTNASDDSIAGPTVQIDPPQTFDNLEAKKKADQDVWNDIVDDGENEDRNL